MKYDRVKFHWLGSDEDTVLSGQVLVRPGPTGGEMVLDINDPAGDGPYLVIGRVPKKKTYFVGTNSANNRKTDVVASWAQIDGAYVGRWTEEKVDYLFQFSIADPET